MQRISTTKSQQCFPPGIAVNLNISLTCWVDSVASYIMGKKIRENGAVERRASFLETHFRFFSILVRGQLCEEASDLQPGEQDQAPEVAEQQPCLQQGQGPLLRQTEQGKAHLKEPPQLHWDHEPGISPDQSGRIRAIFLHRSPGIPSLQEEKGTRHTKRRRKKKIRIPDK